MSFSSQATPFRVKPFEFIRQIQFNCSTETIKWNSNVHYKRAIHFHRPFLLKKKDSINNSDWTTPPHNKQEKRSSRKRGGKKGGRKKNWRNQYLVLSRLLVLSIRFPSFTVKLTDAGDDLNIWRVVPLRSHRCRLPRPYLNLHGQQGTRWPFQVHNTSSKPTSTEDPCPPLLSSRISSALFSAPFPDRPSARFVLSPAPGTAP